MHISTNLYHCRGWHEQTTHFCKLQVPALFAHTWCSSIVGSSLFRTWCLVWRRLRKNRPWQSWKHRSTSRSVASPTKVVSQDIADCTVVSTIRTSASTLTWRVSHSTCSKRWPIILILMNRCLFSLLDKVFFFRLYGHIPCEIHCWACSTGVHEYRCRLYPAATVFGAPGTRHPIHTGFVQLAQQRI